MSFSFNPGQTGQVNQPTESQAPPLVVPNAPAISTAPVQEAVSPFAYKNRNKSQFGVYFQSAIFLIFGVVLLASVGVFTYQRILIAQVESKKQELVQKEATFPKLDLEKIQQLSARIKVINKIITERAYVNTAFKLLEASVLDDSVTFNRFSLNKSKKSKGFNLSFGGETTSYIALYQQIEALNDKKFSRYYTKMTISGTGPLDKKGVAQFKADALVALEGVDPDTFTLDPSTNVKQGQVGVDASSTTKTNMVPVATGTSPQ